MAIERKDVKKNDLFVRPGVGLEKVEKSGQLGGEGRLAEVENWEEKGKQLDEEKQKDVEEEGSYSGSDEEEEDSEDEEEEEDSEDNANEDSENREQRSSFSLLHLLTKNLAQVN